MTKEKISTDIRRIFNGWRVGQKPVLDQVVDYIWNLYQKK